MTRVLIPIDGSQQAKDALDHAIPAFPDADIVLLHVIDPIDSGFDAESVVPGLSEDWYASHKDTAENLFEEARERTGREFDTVIEVGRPARTIVEYAKQGRKERLGLFLITQDPQDVADSVFKQINTTAVLNLGDKDAISAVNIPANLEDKVPYMETGQMVVYSPDNSEPVELIGLPSCLTRHGRD